MNFLLILTSALVVCRAGGQGARSVTLPPNNGESCHVVNVNCGGGGQQASEEGPRMQGPPGKRGGTGLPGLQGNKGDRGNKGEKGEKVDEEEVQANILNAIGAANCRELSSRYGVFRSGFYLMRNEASTGMAYRYCNFSASTCNDLREKFGASADGFYWLEGREWSSAFRAYCNLSGGEAITEVWHDMMDEIAALPKCETPGCYSRRPKYYLDEASIVNLISNHRECRQYIKWRCLGSVLSFSSGFASWASRSGEKMLYWGGATSRREGYCACGETGNCTLEDKKCNCDQNNSPMTQDEGYLTDKSTLPVSEIRFGDLGAASESGWHTLGKLECWGKA